MLCSVEFRMKKGFITSGSDQITAITLPFSSANLNNPAIGSAPGDSTKMRGEEELESS